MKSGLWQQTKPVPKGSRQPGLHVGEAGNRDYAGKLARAKARGWQVTDTSAGKSRP